jgi:hypothetical protein
MSDHQMTDAESAEWQKLMEEYAELTDTIDITSRQLAKVSNRLDELENGTK